MKRMIGLTLACAMLCSIAMPVSADNSLFTVECTGYQETNSDSEVWAALNTDGVMTISGTGAMDYCGLMFMDSGDREFNPPWLSNKDYKNLVEKVIIEEGVTDVRDMGAFPNLKSVYLPDSIEEIGAFEFVLCPSLENLFISPGTVSITPNKFKIVSENFTMYGYKGTYAEEYAGTYEYNFRAMGDMNSDGSVDLSDATEILNRFARAGAGIEEPETEDGAPDTADVNQDETVGIDDATIALTYYASTAAGEEFDWTKCAAK